MWRLKHRGTRRLLIAGRRSAFTLVELLASCFCIGIITAICVNLLATSSTAVSLGIKNTDTRERAYTNISFISKEIESAEYIKIGAGGKKLYIRQTDAEAGRPADPNEEGFFDTIYEIQDGYPCGGLYQILTSGGKGQKLIDLDYEKSYFTCGVEYGETGLYEPNAIQIRLETVQDANNIRNQKLVRIEFVASSRNSTVQIVTE